jgi:hypothetical protein
METTQGFVKKRSIPPPISPRGRDEDEATSHPILDGSRPFSAQFRKESVGYTCLIFLMLNLELSKYKALYIQSSGSPSEN